MNKKLKDKIIKILEIVIIIFISLFCLISLYQKVFNNKELFGYRIFVIVSDSMEPKIHKNDIILVKTEDYQNIKVGDIISYQGLEDSLKDKIIIHEVINTMFDNNTYMFYTKGTNNVTIDPVVYQDQIYGVVKYQFKILSLISRIIRTPIGFILLIVLPLGYTFVAEIIDVKKLINERKK